MAGVVERKGEVPAQVVHALSGVAARAGQRLQVDFEATASQRPFYRALLDDLRSALGPRAGISITALASWCLGDRWLAGLPVDEVVPMLYRLGPRRAEVEEALGRGSGFPAPECRAAIGLSVDEPGRLDAALEPAPRRRYLFSDRAWSAASLRALVGGAKGAPLARAGGPQ